MVRSLIGSSKKKTMPNPGAVTRRDQSNQGKNIKDTVTFYIIISRIIFFLTIILYDMISKTFRNPE